MITNFGNGNPALANLPRKINLGLSPSRDDFPHTHINDVGLVACKDPETGEARARSLPLMRARALPQPHTALPMCILACGGPAYEHGDAKSASAGCRWGT
jgi:hypothetical protein